MNQKSKVREKLRQQREALPTQRWMEANNRLNKVFYDWLKDQSFKSIYFYWPIKQEPNLIQAITSYQNDNPDVDLALPVILDRRQGTMAFYRWQLNEPLVPGFLNTMQPRPEPDRLMIPNKETLICVPALAATRQGDRLGYGAGFYDRYLKQYPEAYSVVALFDEFILDQLPVEPWDCRVQMVLSDADEKDLY